MKKFSFLAVLFIFVISALSFCFADEIPEIVTVTSGDDSQNDPVFINDYDDYLNIVGDEELGDEPVDSEEEMNNQLKQYYEEYQSYLKEYYDNYERKNPEKAEVIEASEEKEDFSIDYNTQSISKYVIQKVKVKVLPGEAHSGEELELDYILTADSLNNIILSRLEKGDIVFVTVSENEDGTIEGDISNSWATVKRVNTILIIAIIVVLLLMIYGGKKGFSTALVSAIAVIFATIIIPNFAHNGSGVILVGILEMLCLIFTINVVHLGISRNSFKSMFISVVISLITWGLISLFNFMTRTVGVSFEFAAIAENIILRNINFVHLYYIITLIISSAFIANATAMAVKRIERESSQTPAERKMVARDVLPANIVPFIVTAFSLYIPNHILLLSNKFATDEIINSETLISEVVRVLVTVIGIILVVPIVSMNVFGIGKKYLKEPDENAQESVEEKTEETAK